MTVKGTFSLSFVTHLLWNLAMWAALISLLALGWMLWSSGETDTKYAFQDGRRLIIQIANGQIKGTQLEDLDKEELQYIKTRGRRKTEEALAKAEPVKQKPETETASETLASEAATTPAEKAPLPDKDGQGRSETVATDRDARSKSASIPDAVTETKTVDKDNNTELKADHLLNKVVPSSSPVRGVNKDLTEKTDTGLVPRIASDGTAPWTYYAKSAEYKGDMPVISVVVTGVGTNKQMTEAANQLPENITLSFSPYARNVETWATAARVTGHEIMLDLPVQPADYPASDPGPYGLLVDGKPEENEKKLQWLLSRFGAFIGVLLPLNDGFSSDTYSLASLMESLADKGLLLMLSRDLARTEAIKMVEESQSPVLIADIFLDEELNEEAIKTRMSMLVQKAKEQGQAVAIARSYPITLEQLKTLPEYAESKGVMLMPVSFITKKRFK